MRRCLNCFEQIKDELEICPFCGYIEDTPAEEDVHISPGTVLAGRYVIGRVLGFGGFGVTYAGWDEKLEQRVAIKEYLPNEFSTRVPGQTRLTVSGGVNREYFNAGLDRFIDEAKRLSKFQQEEGIVRVFDCIAANETAYMIMEYLEGETLSELLRGEGTLTEQEAVSILMPVMRSLETVHRSGIIHRDIAPDNIFLTEDGRVKLIDFGAARYISAELSRSLTVIVKPGYSAEEQYRGNSDQGLYTDVYSLAATLYKMLTGETPPDALERRESIENGRKDPLTKPSKINKDISPVTENAIINALNIRIEDRTPTINAFIEDLTSDAPVKRIKGKIKKTDKYRVPLWIKIAVPVLLVVFIVFGVLLATGVISFQSLFKTDIEVPDGYTVVPDVEGMDVDSAVELLNANGLDYVTGGNVISDYIDADLIVYQDPESSKIVELASTVVLTVSRGSGDVVLPSDGISTVPAFLWSNEEDAIRDFETAGLNVNTEYIFDNNITAGQVIRAADENRNELHAGDVIPENSLVTLYISSPAPVEDTESSGISEINANVLNIDHHSFACLYGCGSWEEARGYCESLGGYLAVVDSQETNDALYTFIRYCGYSSAYIGYSDSENEGVWSWVNSGRSAYTNWNEGEPNAFTDGEDYAFISDNGKWFDGDFSPAFENGIVCFICEWDNYITGSANIDRASILQLEDEYYVPEEPQISTAFTEELAVQAFENYFNSLYGDYTGQAPCYWTPSPDQCTDDTYVYFHRAYTGALIYYYLDMNTGLVRDVAYTGVAPMSFSDIVFNAWDYIPGMEINSVDIETLKLNDEELFNIVMARIDENEEVHPGSMYAISSITNYEYINDVTWGDVDRWCLSIRLSDGSVLNYAIDDYGLLPFESGVVDLNGVFVSYNDIRSLSGFMVTTDTGNEQPQDYGDGMYLSALSTNYADSSACISSCYFDGNNLIVDGSFDYSSGNSEFRISRTTIVFTCTANTSYYSAGGDDEFDHTREEFESLLDQLVNSGLGLAIYVQNGTVSSIGFVS